MELRYELVCKRFGAADALIDLDLHAPDGCFLVMLGPSGCGKTTALRLLAGLDDPTSGRMFIGPRDVTPLQPRERDIAMVFQSYALYPHKTVAENIEYPLRIRRLTQTDRQERVAQVAKMLNIDAYLERYPRQLSGGQRQRVALARAIVRQPQAFLMDEPLSNLDAQLRFQMRAELKRLQKSLAVTTVYVTHDQLEAMTMADLIAVLSNGRLQQLATPAEIYARPANLFVASFCGSPPMNLLHGTVTNGHFQRAEGTFPIDNWPALSKLRGQIHGAQGRRREVRVHPFPAAQPSISAQGGLGRSGRPQRGTVSRRVLDLLFFFFERKHEQDRDRHVPGQRDGPLQGRLRQTLSV